ncbi:MAG: DUF4148 domain-containing protein, partial [Burkholderiaceae bacterium]|nr:DUF4148 domain-containing protein [Burkholderiaceae bacterium]
NQLFPAQYAQPVAVQGKTRAEVKAELAEAIRTGDIVADGATGAKANELFLAGKTRDDVRAELVNSSRANGG